MKARPRIQRDWLRWLSEKPPAFCRAGPHHQADGSVDRNGFCGDFGCAAGFCVGFGKSASRALDPSSPIKDFISAR